MLAPRKKLWSTPSSAIDIALEFAELDMDDVVYDVGCGDGRVLIQMAAMSVLPPVTGGEALSSNDDHAVEDICHGGNNGSSSEQFIIHQTQIITNHNIIIITVETS